MSVKNTLKGMLYKLPHPAIDCFYKIYNRVQYPDMVEKHCSFGDMNPDLILYVIRPRTDGVEGLMALFLSVVKHINYAEKKNYVPVVDFQNYYTQYYDKNRNCKNVWEYYFLQPSNVRLEDVYQSKNVILSGLSSLSKSDEYLNKMDEESLSLARKFVKKYILLSPEADCFVSAYLSDINPEETLGLYLRGTDYIKLRPAGHPVQPSVEQAVKKAKEVMETYNLKYVFLVTEDNDIYQQVKSVFMDRLRIVSYDAFVSDYDGSTFLSKNERFVSQLASSPYQRGLNYLTKLIILSHCKCFVGGNTCGSWAANVFSAGFDKSYIFDLGTY